MCSYLNYVCSCVRFFSQTLVRRLLHCHTSVCFNLWCAKPARRQTFDDSKYTRNRMTQNEKEIKKKRIEQKMERRKKIITSIAFHFVVISEIFKPFHLHPSNSHSEIHTRDTHTCVTVYLPLHFVSIACWFFCMSAVNFFLYSTSSMTLDTTNDDDKLLAKMAKWTVQATFLALEKVTMKQIE